MEKLTRQTETEIKTRNKTNLNKENDRFTHIHIPQIKQNRDEVETSTKLIKNPIKKENKTQKAEVDEIKDKPALLSIERLCDIE